MEPALSVDFYFNHQILDLRREDIWGTTTPLAKLNFCKRWHSRQSSKLSRSIFLSVSRSSSPEPALFTSSYNPSSQCRVFTHSGILQTLARLLKPNKHTYFNSHVFHWYPTLLELLTFSHWIFFLPRGSLQPEQKRK